MAVRDLTPDVWTHLTDRDLLDGYFSRATPLHKKNAVKTLLTLWGDAVIRDKVMDFDAWMISVARDGRDMFATPPRGAKRRLADTVVTAGDAGLTAADGDAAVADI